MLQDCSAQVELQVEVIKEPHGTERYCCDEKCLNGLIQSWKGSYILVTGLAGIGKTSLCVKLARELDNREELKVYKFESIDELKESEGRHFIYTHENHELIILVDNVTSSQLSELPTTHVPNTTTILFSRTLLVDKFDCVLKIRGTPWRKSPQWDNHSLWKNHIKVLCSIPFLFVSFASLSSNSVSCHDIYFLLLVTYMNYCQTLQVSLFTSIKEVPVKVEKFLRNIADVAYHCLSNNCEFIDECQLRKFCDVGGEMGVVTQSVNGKWKFTFEGSADCLTALKLFWINEERFDKDTQVGNIRVPNEAMKLFKEMRTDSRSALSTKSILDIDITLQPVGGEVKLGGSVSLVCSASILGPPGMALPTFLWFKNGKALTGEVLNKLIIDEASEKDAGEYVCYVADVHDKVHRVTKPAHISVKSMEPPSVVPKSIVTEKQHVDDYPKPLSVDYQLVLKELDTEIRDHVDITSLLPYLMKHQLLSSTDLYVLSNDMLTPSDRAERLLMSIKVKGQDGYDKFVACLEEEQEHLGHHHLLTLINRRGVSNLNKKSKDVTSKQSLSFGDSASCSITVTIQPEAQVECNRGEEVIIMCGATGMVPLQYEWYKDDRCVSRDQVLELKYVDEQDIGQYRCKITDGYDSVWSNPTIVKLKAPEPASLKQDMELTDRKLSEIATELSHIGEKWEKLGFYLNVDQNTIARIRYEQRNTMSKIYQLLRRWRDKTPDASWSKLEQSIRWIGASLQQPRGAGATSLYRASHIPTSTYSFEAPVILKHPEDQIGVLEGGPVTLEIKAKGASLSYQWHFNNRPVKGATSPCYIIPHSTLSDTGDYHCQVKNLYGLAESNSARVYITIGTTGATGALSGRFLISRNPDIKYPPSTLGLSNTPSLVEGSQSTPVSLDKTFKNVTSQPEKYLLDPPEKQVMSLPPKDITQTDGKVIIFEHPQGGTYRVGDQLKLVCHADGAHPLFYRWELNNMSLTHERRPQLYIPQLTTDDEGWYRCQVSNKFSRTYSDSCRIVVRSAK